MVLGFVWKCLGLILICVAIKTLSVEGKHIQIPAKACSAVFVGLTVSSLTTTSPHRQLELVWANADPRSGDYVGLYDDAAMTTPLVKITVSSANGYNATGVAAPITEPNLLTFDSECLGFYVAYVRNEDQVLASGCLETSPRWMSDMRSEISPLRLNKVFLPGAHDACAYKEYDGTAGNVVERYSFTQEEDVLSLLVHGARYLDIRVAHRAGFPDVWWTNHGAVYLRPLRVILEQVKRFVQNTDEIVIFDIHGLTGFQDSTSINDAFAAHLVAQLGDYAVPSSLTWSATLGDVWASGRRLVVTYPDDRVVAAHPELWSGVTHKWGDVNKVQDLYDYGVTVFSSTPPSRAWSFMAELTPSATDIALDRLGGLRGMADTVNQNVTTWFSLDWGMKANIVSSDFFRGNSIVQEAVEWNLYRATGNPCQQNAASNKKKPDKKKKNKKPHLRG